VMRPRFLLPRISHSRPPRAKPRPQEAICGPASTHRDRSITQKPPPQTAPTLDIFIRASQLGPVLAREAVEGD
jgi:hypothetical protein